MLLILIGLSSILFGCDNSVNQNNKAVEMKTNSLKVTEDIRQALLKISNHKIIFAHHSVGRNVIGGLKSLANEAGVDFKVEHMESVSMNNQGAFLEFEPGKNTLPKTKIDGFVDQIQKLDSGSVPDAAFMKFCFIDFSPETNVEEVINYYKINLEKLKKENPQIRFIHFTVPLMEKPGDIKSRIKRFLGKEVWVDASNVTRARFNELLFKSFPEDPVFDLAKFESTRMDGSRESFSYNNKTYYSLVSEYTNDGSHLNSLGQRIIAAELAKFLASKIQSQ